MLNPDGNSRNSKKFEIAMLNLLDSWILKNLKHDDENFDDIKKIKLLLWIWFLISLTTFLHKYFFQILQEDEINDGDKVKYNTIWYSIKQENFWLKYTV